MIQPASEGLRMIQDGSGWTAYDSEQGTPAGFRRILKAFWNICKQVKSGYTLYFIDCS